MHFSNASQEETHQYQHKNRIEQRFPASFGGRFRKNLRSQKTWYNESEGARKSCLSPEIMA